MWSYIAGGVFLALAIYFLVQGIRCGAAVRESKNRLAAYNAQTAALSYGEITYVDSGEGEVILSVHGIFGGYDQAYDTCKDFCSDYRIIAPSRFGYLGSDVSGDGTPARQAAAYVELLDMLGIDKVYLLATSAGGSVAIRFALDYPQRTKGLILFPLSVPNNCSQKGTGYERQVKTDEKVSGHVLRGSCDQPAGGAVALYRAVDVWLGFLYPL